MTVTVSPQSLAQHRADWVKFVSVWERIVDYLADPTTRDDGIKNAIIKATNRQTLVSDEQLFALSDFPKQLLDYGCW